MRRSRGTNRARAGLVAVALSTLPGVTGLPALPGASILGGGGVSGGGVAVASPVDPATPTLARPAAPAPTRSTATTLSPLAPDTLRLSLDQAVLRALETGQEVRQVEEALVQIEEEITQVRAGVFPQITGNLTYTRQLRSIFDGLGADLPANQNGMDDEDNPFANLPFGRPNTWIASLSVSQTLYAAGQVGIGLDIADRVRTVLGHEMDETRAQLAQEVRQAYFESVFTELLVGIAEEAWEMADRQLAEVESFERQGVASDLDVLTARVERDNLEPRIVESAIAARLARQNLRRLANLPRDAPLELTTRLEAELLDVDRAALEEAVLERPALQAASEQVAIGRDQVRLARSGYRPTASAFAEFGYQNLPETVFPRDDWLEDWNVGVRLSVPIFNGFRTRAEVQEARSGTRQAELERELLEEGLLLEFDGAIGDFDAALSQIEARRATVQQAERALELAELRFAAGSATALELSNARLNLQQARVNEVEALLGYVDALARLERISGGRIPLLAPRIRAADSDAPPQDDEPDR